MTLFRPRLSFLRALHPSALTKPRPYSSFYASETCNNCGRTRTGSCGLSLIRCSSCSNLLPPSNTPLDYYSLFCIPRTLRPDLASLRHQYLKLQRLLHPDNFPLSSPDVKASSESWSGLLNRAYEVLKDPQRRAVYLYNISSGQNFAEESTFDKDTASPRLNSLLARVLDIRSDLEDAENPTEVKQILQDNDASIAAAMEDLDVAFKAEGWSRAKELLVELRYLKSIEAAAKNVLEDLES